MTEPTVAGGSSAGTHALPPEDPTRHPRRRRGGAGPRLRRPVLAADRAADPRMRRLLPSCCRSTTPVEEIREREPKALVLSGGPASVYEPGAPPFPTQLLDLEHPDAGHLLRDAGDGPGAGRQGRGRRGRASSVAPSWSCATVAAGCSAACPRSSNCWMSHRDAVFEPPPGFTALASSPGSPVAACEMPDRGLYGIQFHPEVVHTPYGTEILTRFLRDVAGCEQQWSPAVGDRRADRQGSRPRSARAG